MEANQATNPRSATCTGLIPDHFARISLRHSHEAGERAARRCGIRVVNHPINQHLELVYEWQEGGKLLMVVDSMFECAWADTAIL